MFFMIIWLITIFSLFFTCKAAYQKRKLKLDIIILNTVYKWKHPLVDLLMNSVTSFGYLQYLTVGVLINLIILGLKKLFYEAALLVIICFSTEIVTRIMKRFFRKTRPLNTSNHHPISDGSLSFPSGHASGSLLVYGFLSYLLTRSIPSFSILIIILTSTIITLTGISRIYLRMHWPTDVVAGYALGASALLLTIYLVEY
jgi:membrane-associated phospholipid phosphatase